MSKQNRGKKRNSVHHVSPGKIEKEYYKYLIKKPENGIDFTESPFDDYEDTNGSPPRYGEVTGESKKAVPPSWKLRTKDFFNDHVMEGIIISLLLFILGYSFSFNRELGQVHVKIDMLSSSFEKIEQGVNDIKTNVEVIKVINTLTNNQKI